MVIDEQSAEKQVVLNFIQRAKDSLRAENLLVEPGAVLYSTWETLKRGDYYFLGVNPAGSEEDKPATTEDFLDKLSTSEENEYIDVCWYNNPPDPTKRRPLQERFIHLFTKLEVNPREVCASNLIFSSSKKERDSGGWEKAKKCWPVHEIIIREIVQPRVIITFGSLPFDFIREKLCGKQLEECDSGHGKWKWRYSILETGEKLIGLPHLSRYALQKNPKVIEGIRERLGLTPIKAS
jgi:hypothetical protein